jgi:hypothetical protein
MSTDLAPVGPAVHLLAAGELFRRGFPSMGVAVCGEPVSSGPDLEDPQYCPSCVREALRWCAGRE